MIRLLTLAVAAGLLVTSGRPTAQVPVLDIVEQDGVHCCDAMAIAPDGRLLATAIEGLAVSPGARWLAAGTAADRPGARGTVILWALDGASPPRWLWEDEDGGSILGIAFSPDEHLLGAASLGTQTPNRASGLLRGNISVCQLPWCDKRTRLLDPDKDTSSATALVYPESAATDLRFTNGGRTIVAAVLGVIAQTDEEIQFHEYEPYPRLLFFDARTLRPRRAAAIGGRGFPALAVSADGRFVATAHDEHTARVWRAATARQHRVFVSSTDVGSQGAGLVRGVAFDHDGRRLATAGESGMALWNLATGARIQELDAEHSYGAAGFTPDGSLLVGGECVSTFGDHLRANIRAWDAATLQPRWTVGISGTCVSRLAFDPRGRWFAASTPAGVLIHALTSGAPLMQLAVADGKQWLAWTPNGRYAGTAEGIASLAAVRQATRALPLPSLGKELRLADLFAQVLR